MDHPVTPGILQICLKSLLSKLEDVADITQTRFFSQPKHAIFTDISEPTNNCARYNARLINADHFGKILSSLVSSVKRTLNLKAGSLVNRRK